MHSLQDEEQLYEAALEQRRREVEAQQRQGEKEQAMRMYQQGLLRDDRDPASLGEAP